MDIGGIMGAIGPMMEIGKSLMGGAGGEEKAGKAGGMDEESIAALKKVFESNMGSDQKLQLVAQILDEVMQKTEKEEGGNGLQDVIGNLIGQIGGGEGGGIGDLLGGLTGGGKGGGIGDLLGGLGK